MGDDIANACFHNENMARAPDPDWYLKDWALALGKRQGDLVTVLGVQKNTAFKLWHGTQPYRRDYVNAVAAWLNLRPYELLMPPDEALALRRLREDVARIVSGAAPVEAPTRHRA